MGVGLALVSGLCVMVRDELMLSGQAVMGGRKWASNEGWAIMGGR